MKSLVFVLGFSSLISCHSPRQKVSTSSNPPVPAQSGAGAGRTTPSSATNHDMNDLQDCIVKHWIHSHEEDGPDTMVYRPATYRFPPARGRTGFELQPGGKAIYYAIGRADGAEAVAGRWTLANSKLLRIVADQDRFQPIVLEVLSCNESTLTVRPPKP